MYPMHPHRMPAPDIPEENLRAFPLTCWSVVVAAREDSATALEQLCRVYWPALYAFSRRSGDSHEDACDLVQGFFAMLIGRSMLDAVTQEKGRFRSWLLAAFSNYSRSEWRRAHREKRGGGKTTLSLEAAEGALDLPHNCPAPNDAFEQKWAESLLRTVLTKLRAEFTASGRQDLFAVLKSYLTSPRGAVPYTEAAARTGLSESAVKSAIHRLRQRYGVLLREEVAQTVQNDCEVEDEIRWLLSVLAR